MPNCITRHNQALGLGRFALALACFSLLAGPMSAGTFGFALLPPGGSLLGLPGVPVGWGYSLSNPSPSQWLELYSLEAGSFAAGTPISLFDFPVLAPMQTSNRAWVLDTEGLYQFTFDLGAPLGLSNIGMFTVEGNFWSADPMDPGSGGVILDTGSASQEYRVTNVIPEPGAWPLVSVALGWLWLRRRRAG